MNRSREETVTSGSRDHEEVRIRIWNSHPQPGRSPLGKAGQRHWIGPLEALRGGPGQPPQVHPLWPLCPAAEPPRGIPGQLALPELAV